jgi:hypothetical protein
MTTGENAERRRDTAVAFWVLALASRLLGEAVHDGRDIRSIWHAPTDSATGNLTGACEIRISVGPWPQAADANAAASEPPCAQAAV